jgi:two-component system, OmpR family, sensor histidine kinase BaeS
MTLAALALGGWITALVAVAATLATRHALAQRLEAIARASHELRGGIGAARLGLTAAAPAGALAGSRLRAVGLELDRASLALDDIDGRARSWAFADVDVEELLTDCVEAARASAAVWGVELRMSWAGQPAIVAADRVRLGQAAGNLIANAIEHGGGVVEVRGGFADDAVTVEVLDDGPGLQVPVAELIRRPRREGGRGFGLGIAAEIVKGHGGRLAAAPSVTGARLVVELPARAPLQGRLQAS